MFPKPFHILAAENPGKIQKLVTLLKLQIENGRSASGPKLKNDKNVKMIDLADRRLPGFVKKFAK